MKNDPFLVSMGARISERRKELKITQEQLAESIGVSMQSISCIELGKKAVRPENLANICTQLHISSDYILLGKRDNCQMNDTIKQLSTLSKDKYDAISNVINLLNNK